MKKFLYAGMGLLALTNLVVFAGIYYNRSTDTPQQLTLSERELALPYPYETDENSALSLRLKYQVDSHSEENPYAYYASRELEVDGLKLQELGFDPEQLKQQRGAYWLSNNKEVFWLLEFNGGSYQRYLQDAQSRYQSQLEEATGRENADELLERAERQLNDAQQHSSRLFVIDADLDPNALQASHQDNRFLILKGLVEARWHPDNTKNNQPGHYSLNFRGLSVEQIMLNQGQGAKLAGLEQGRKLGKLMADQQDDLHFQAQIHWGKRYEPWVVTLNTL